MAVSAEEQRAQHLIRMGEQLERTTERLRWVFKRASNWERDQSIRNIQHIHGPGFTRNMSLATKFGLEWGSVFGTVHSTVIPEEMQSEFDKFVKIPPRQIIIDAGQQSTYGTCL